MNDINKLFFEGQCKRRQSQARLGSAKCSLTSIFYQLIRVAIGNQVCLSCTPSADEWGELYAMAKKQSLVGVCFEGVQKLVSQQQAPPEMLYLKWMGMAAKIQQRNEVVNRQCVEVQKRIEADGFRTFIMKGQGNSALYRTSYENEDENENLSMLRQSGDIDIYLEGGFEKVYDYVQSTCPTKEVNELEIHYHILKDTEVEIHYRPFIMRNPVKNKKLQKFLKEEGVKCFENKIALPNDAGEINKGRTAKNEILTFLKEKLGYIEGCVGCICVQLFFHPTTKDMVGIEINPRFGGGYPLSYNCGGNYPELLIREYFMGEEVEYFDNWKDGMLMLRYDDAIYV